MVTASACDHGYRLNRQSNRVFMSKNIPTHIAQWERKLALGIIFNCLCFKRDCFLLVYVSLACLIRHEWSYFI